jgi:hypothetical protein
VLPLDPRTFLAETLKPYATGALPGLPGLFERYLLEPSDNDDAAIVARMSDVKAIWDKSLEHTRYGGLAKALSAEHEQDHLDLKLGDPRERARLATDAENAAHKAEEKAATARAEWRELLAESVANNGGLTANTRATLERIGKTTGLDAQFVQTELDRAPVAAPPAVMDEEVRTQIQKSLRELARVVGEERLALSLYHALGLEGITEDLTEVQRQYDKVTAQNQARGFGQTATAYKTVLANVKLYLLDADPRAYVEGLIVDIGTAMELEVARSATDNVIDPTEAEALLQSAIRRGVTPDLGRRLISDLAREQGAGLEVGAAVDYVECPACNTPHARPTAPFGCKRCGTPLFVVCPTDGCGTRNDATALRCSTCQTDLFKFAEATRRLGGLPDAVDDGRVGWAAAELKEITRVLGAAAIPDQLRRRLDELMGNAEATWSLVESAIAERRLYAARSALRDLVRTAGDVLGPTGDRPDARVREVDRRLTDVDAALARARATTGRARETALVEAVGIAEDCEEAVSALAAIPPEPPGSVTVELGVTGPVVSWAPSNTTGARYLVRRLDAGTNESADVSSSGATHCEDRDAPSGTVVRYEVATLRGRARSAPVQSAALLVAREVQGLAVADADAEVRLSWQAVPASARVIVRRSAERTGVERDLIADRSGVVDRDVENGERYAYRVTVEYGAGGEAQRTPGVTIYGQPAPPPTGIDALGIRPVPGGVVIDFERPPSGTVSILRCTEEPSVSHGDTLDPETVAGLGRPLVVGADGARDDSSSGICWYLPVTVAGGTAVAGRSARHVALADITNVTVVETSAQARVTWEWPGAVRIAKVIWRRDRQPLGPDDPGVDSAWVRFGEYRDNGGFTIERGEPGSLFVAVVPGIRTDGELIAGTSISRGSRASIRSTAKADLHYAVRHTGRFKTKGLEVEVDAPSGVTPPSLVLVARSGDLLPRTAEQGDVLARLGGGEPLSSSIDLSGRSRPLMVRLFLESASSEAQFQIFDPGADELLVR